MKTTIKLKVNGSELEMGDARMSLDMINSLFNGLSDYSLPFPIPVTENNLDTLGIDHDILAYITSTKYETGVSLEIGIFILNGVLIIEGSGNNHYLSSTFYSNQAEFYSKVSGKYLTDVVYTEAIHAQYIYESLWMAKATDSANNFYPDYNYVFAPVYMPNFGDEDLSGKVEPEIINKWDMENQTFYFPVETGERSSHFAPYFYLCFVIDKIFQSFGYVISTNELYDNLEFRQLVVFHTTHDNILIPYADFSKHLPYVLITEFLQTIEKKLNLKFIFSSINNTVKIKFFDSIIEETTLTDITNIADPDSQIIIDRFDGFEIQSAVNTDSDSSWQDSLLNDLDKLDNSMFDYLVNNVSDLPAVPVLGLDLGAIAFIKQRNEIYLYDWNYTTEAAEWILLGTSFINMKVPGENILSIPQNSSDLLMFDVESDNVKYLPRCDQERELRIRRLHKQKNKYQDVTLLFYRGKYPYNSVPTFADLPVSPSANDVYFVADENESYIWADVYFSGYDWYNVDDIDKDGKLGTMNINAYPYLTNSRSYKVNDDLYKAYPSNVESLCLFGDNGLYTRYYEKYIFWMQNIIKKESRVLNINESFLGNFQWDMIFRIKNQNYFISRIPMEIDFARQTINFGECELLSL